MNDEKILKQDIVNALKEMDTFVDITVDDLLSINQKAIHHARLRVCRSLPVENIMTTPVYTINPDTSIEVAAKIMLNKNIAGLPVVDADNNLIGIFTEADLLTAIGVPRQKPQQTIWGRLETIFGHEPALGDFYEDVNQLMIKQVFTVEKNNTLDDVLSKMKTGNINRLVVIEENKVIGILTRSNLIRVLLQYLSLK